MPEPMTYHFQNFEELYQVIIFLQDYPEARSELGKIYLIDSLPSLAAPVSKIVNMKLPVSLETQSANVLSGVESATSAFF